MNRKQALISVSDKTGLVPLAKAFLEHGIELIASGGTLKALADAGLPATPVERISGSPEAFQGRMKTLSFKIFSGILFRRDDDADIQEANRHQIPSIDFVVVNFYPFEKALDDAQKSAKNSEMTELIDIGGPALVRAAAKNSAHVTVLTNPSQYARVIAELKSGITEATRKHVAREAWEAIARYDSAIEGYFGEPMTLRYGENPHQLGKLHVSANSPIDWRHPLTENPLSYNNILDLSSAYLLVCDLKRSFPDHQSVVIVKHNNPCGVSVVRGSQVEALKRAWRGDPISAFGGVLAFSHPLEEETATWLGKNFIELVAAPELLKSSASLSVLTQNRKNLKAVSIRSFLEKTELMRVSVPGGVLEQEMDLFFDEPLRSVTKTAWNPKFNALGKFGVLVCKALKSNAIACVWQNSDGGFELVGAGQGQPNRVDSLAKLSVPRAIESLKRAGGELKDVVLVSDAFFPFRDSIDLAAELGIRRVIQPGGSKKDDEVVRACDEHGIEMALTATRHFKH